VNSKIAFKTKRPLLSVFPTGKTGLHCSSGVRGIGADNSVYNCDKCFEDQTQHKVKAAPLDDKAHSKKPSKCYGPADFTYDIVAVTFVCLTGKLL